MKSIGEIKKNNNYNRNQSEIKVQNNVGIVNIYNEFK